MKKLIRYFTEKPRTIFLIDSLGALMTACSLIFIVGQFNQNFGMPEEHLTYLGIIAITYSIYSAVCYLFLRKGFTPFLRIIGIANLLYSSLTIILLISVSPILTIVGHVYFLLEAAIIISLSYIELNVAEGLKT